jgi:hypothetical protein
MKKAYFSQKAYEKFGCAIYLSLADGKTRVCATEICDVDTEPTSQWDDLVYCENIDPASYIETVGSLLEYDTREIYPRDDYYA